MRMGTAESGFNSSYYAFSAGKGPLSGQNYGPSHGGKKGHFSKNGQKEKVMPVVLKRVRWCWCLYAGRGLLLQHCIHIFCTAIDSIHRGTLVAFRQVTFMKVSPHVSMCKFHEVFMREKNPGSVYLTTLKLLKQQQKKNPTMLKCQAVRFVHDFFFFLLPLQLFCFISTAKRS